ncbi:hypothetical protein OROHE_009234 [Orobanche hederae]
MGWVKRSANTVIPTERTAHIYPPCSFNFTIVLHHHGKFNNTMTAYEEGAVDYFDFCNVDEMSMIEIKEIMKMCGIDVKSEKCYLSKNGINCCRQLEEVVTGIDAYRLGFSIDESDSIGVFIHRKSDEGERVDENEDVDEDDAKMEGDDEMEMEEDDGEQSDNDDTHCDRSIYINLGDERR